ncbi:MAG: nucleotide exchange factor GrpE [Leeuwenhoekiella sp.]|nr:nucleotide exchange factor GrpE [Leeuwenhoekiella sp.]
MNPIIGDFGLIHFGKDNLTRSMKLANNCCEIRLLENDGYNFLVQSVDELIQLFHHTVTTIDRSKLLANTYDCNAPIEIAKQPEIQKAKDKNLQKGVELISNKLRETLKSKGLKEMEVSAGDVFDADIHEAITQIPAPKDSLKGKIVDVIEKGYELGDKIIRFPKVVTGK